MEEAKTNALIPFDAGCRRIGYSTQHCRRLVREGKIRPPVRLHQNGRLFWTDEILDEIIIGAAAAA